MESNIPAYAFPSGRKSNLSLTTHRDSGILWWIRTHSLRVILFSSLFVMSSLSFKHSKYENIHFTQLDACVVRYIVAGAAIDEG